MNAHKGRSQNGGIDYEVNAQDMRSGDEMCLEKDMESDHTVCTTMVKRSRFCSESAL